MNISSQEAMDKISSTLSERRKRILNVYISHGYALTDKQVAVAVGWPINCVTGRVRELINMGLIEVTGRVLDPATGVRVRACRYFNTLIDARKRAEADLRDFADNLIRERG